MMNGGAGRGDRARGAAVLAPTGYGGGVAGRAREGHRFSVGASGRARRRGVLGFWPCTARARVRASTEKKARQAAALGMFVARRPLGLPGQAAARQSLMICSLVVCCILLSTNIWVDFEWK